MFHVILYQPEIPPNTGNIIRLCANTGSKLHLIHPLGFAWDDKRVKRAGLDYHDLTHVVHHDNWESFLSNFEEGSLYAMTSKGTTSYHSPKYKSGDGFLFGPETRGLPQTLLSTFSDEKKIYIPQLTTARSLNLSNAVSVMIYEAWRQCAFLST